MPVFLSSIGAAIAYYVVGKLADACVGIVGRILVALGIGTVTVTGYNAVITSLLTTIQAQLGVNTQVYSMLDAMGVMWLISTVFSAITTRMLIAGLMSDSTSFWVKRMTLPKS